MKRKFSLFLNVAVLALCVCAIAIGVYSAKQASLSVTGTVGFTAHNCELQVSGTKKGYALGDGTTYQESAVALTMGADNATTGTVSGSGASGVISSIALGDLKFTDLATEEIPPIVITLTFTNLSAYQVSATVLVDDIANVKYTRQYVMGQYTETSSLTNHVEAVILGDSNADNKTATFVITLNVADSSKDVTNLSTLNITANFAKYDASTLLNTYTDEQNNEYTLDSNKKSYSLSSGTSATVPQFINHLPVTSIGSYAFGPSLSIIIPNSVISIGNCAFYNSALRSIVIPSSVTSIGVNAFSGCNLVSINIPSSVTSISVGPTASFWGCSSLRSITVDSGNTVYDSRDNCNAIIETSTNTLIAGCANTDIPIDVTCIEYGAFAGSTGLTSITIPASVTSIGRMAFDDCSSLTNVTFEETTSWYVGDSKGAQTTALNSSDLANTSTAATYLKSNYYSLFWTRDV